MSDKTKWLADKARVRQRMIEWYRREQARPKYVLTCCQCGETKGDIWACGLGPATKFYCDRHLPDDQRITTPFREY